MMEMVILPERCCAAAATHVRTLMTLLFAALHLFYATRSMQTASPMPADASTYLWQALLSVPNRVTEDVNAAVL